MGALQLDSRGVLTKCPACGRTMAEGEFLVVKINTEALLQRAS